MNPLATIVISSGGLVHSLIWLIIVGLILGAAYWAIGLIPQAQIQKVLRVIWWIVVVVIVLNLLLGLVGEPIIRL